MKRSSETFKVTEEFGERLRELRLKAGVSQQELAVLMGRQGSGGHRLVGMIERGKVPFPSLGFVADYLRACRAGFGDVLDILDSYTSKPTTVEQRGYERVRSVAAELPPKAGRATRRYDRKMAATKDKPEPIDRRLARAENYGRAQSGQYELDELMSAELAKAGVDSASADAARLRLYARKLWGVLNHTRDLDAAKREHELDKLALWVTRSGLPHLEDFDRITAAVRELSESQS
jgi:transcriptional regulator with XRE-family HTH domain